MQLKANFKFAMFRSIKNNFDSTTIVYYYKTNLQNFNHYINHILNNLKNRQKPIKTLKSVKNPQKYSKLFVWWVVLPNLEIN